MKKHFPLLYRLLLRKRSSKHQNPLCQAEVRDGTGAQPPLLPHQYLMSRSSSCRAGYSLVQPKVNMGTVHIPDPS